MYEDSDKVGFVADGGPQAAPRGRAPGEAPTARLLGDRVVLLLLAVTLVLQLFTLGRLEGYQLADSVEYMDRAQVVAAGGTLDPATVRSFAFSALMVPIFWLSDLLGLGDATAALFIRALVMGLGLVTVLVVTRTGMRLFGRLAGLAAGAFLALSPTFLQYGVEPLSGGAALLAIALAVEAGTRAREGRAALRDGALTGLWAGLALMLAFKTVPIGALLLLGLVLRGRWRLRGLWLAGFGVFGLVLLAQCLLDQWIYGSFGSSLIEYLLTNVGSQVASLLLKLHALGVPGAYDAAASIYEAVYSDNPVATTSDNVAQVLRSSTGRTWYLERLTSQFLVWPAAVAFGLGSLLGLVRRRRAVPLLLAVLLLNVLVLSVKSSKSFRLWQPLLPMVALLAGLGLAQLVELVRARLGLTAARLVGGLLLLGTLVGGQLTLARTNLVKYGAWWEAVEHLDAAAARAGETWTYTSAYHWAVRFRPAEHLELTKLPYPMDRWGHLLPEQREEVLVALEELDGFIAHRQILTQDPRILRRVNARFEIAEILFDEAAFEELDVLYVLRKRTEDPQRTFFELYEDLDPGPYQASIQTPHSVDFRRRLPDGSALQMVLLGWDVETGLAQGQLAWLTLHWYVGNTGGKDYTIVLRLTDPDDRALDDNHEPAHGAWPTSQLQPGWILRESYQLRLPTDPRRFGGANSRGDLVPCRLWLNIAEFEDGEPGEQPRLVGGLNPFQPSGQRPISRIDGVGPHVSEAGYRWSGDALLQVGGIWLPVPRGGELADDGRPLAPPAGAPPEGVPAL